MRTGWARGSTGLASFAVGVALAAQIAAAAPQTDGTAGPGPNGTGPAGAPATIVEYTDFASGSCGRLQFMLKAIADTYPAGVRIVVKLDPRSDDPATWLAEEGALAAGAQGKFWEMTDLLFANEGRRTRNDLVGMAKQLGLDTKQFAADLDSGRFRADVDADRAEAAKRKIGGTPAYFLNDAPQPWPTTFPELKKRVAAAVER